MAQEDLRRGRERLRAALREDRGAFRTVALVSLAVNLLMLTGPVYMLNVYDRVLSSGSVETLVALSGLALFLYAMMGLLDGARGRIMVRAGARMQARLDGRVFRAVLRQPRPGGPPDLEALRRLIASPVMTAGFDLPFVPLFLGAIFLLHPLLGALAVGGAVAALALTAANRRSSLGLLTRAEALGREADRRGVRLREEHEVVQALGMARSAEAHWAAYRAEALATATQAAEVNGLYGTTGRTVRLILQSAMLGLGAWLVLRQQLSPGAMIAGSILLSRAMMPVETILGQWSLVQQAQEARDRLARLLAENEPRRRHPPPKRGPLVIEGLSVVPPGRTEPALRGVSFRLAPGRALGVIGPVGSGKSALAKALAGAWSPASGSVRLGGVDLSRYGDDAPGDCLGYLPQRVALFEGTVRENIARLAPDAEDHAVSRAARTAGAHEFILRMPEGYDTRIGGTGPGLSGGQMQRIGLARALYGDPALVILDEPNAHQGDAGTRSLNAAIRELKAAGACVVVTAHRPGAIEECDLLLALDGGRVRALGPREQVLREVLDRPGGPGLRSATAR
ncbi:type I secretion system permease/ATPase [Histidinibacterium aquaticum]|uniref:Type I secretion system permease/ATPase n=1 Tax=Histidinibacterium aquaticum TaxID=2613962 RepID=A0A5J5GH95_9RHOB|nr:type I secretion system permease/ATPase [Histidinibacterium aquaticum]KAA9007112.1 type I secretion system permease/ATPase [Histidinibacterium aquaticum]